MSQDANPKEAEEKNKKKKDGVYPDRNCEDRGKKNRRNEASVKTRGQEGILPCGHRRGGFPQLPRFIGQRNFLGVKNSRKKIFRKRERQGKTAHPPGNPPRALSNPLGKELAELRDYAERSINTKGDKRREGPAAAREKRLEDSKGRLGV